MKLHVFIVRLSVSSGRNAKNFMYRQFQGKIRGSSKSHGNPNLTHQSRSCNFFLRIPFPRDVTSHFIRCCKIFHFCKNVSCYSSRTYLSQSMQVTPWELNASPFPHDYTCILVNFCTNFRSSLIRLSIRD